MSTLRTVEEMQWSQELRQLIGEVAIKLGSEKGQQLADEIKKARTETDQQARERCAKIISELQYQNALIKEGNSPVIKNARNGGYILNEHQRRMDMEFDKALQAISNPPSQV